MCIAQAICFVSTWLEKHPARTYIVIYSYEWPVAERRTTFNPEICYPYLVLLALSYCRCQLEKRSRFLTTSRTPCPAQYKHVPYCRCQLEKRSRFLMTSRAPCPAQSKPVPVAPCTNMYQHVPCPRVLQPAVARRSARLATTANSRAATASANRTCSATSATSVHLARRCCPTAAAKVRGQHLPGGFSRGV